MDNLGNDVLYSTQYRKLMEAITESDGIFNISATQMAYIYNQVTKLNSTFIE